MPNLCHSVYTCLLSSGDIDTMKEICYYYRYQIQG